MANMWVSLQEGVFSCFDFAGNKQETVIDTN